MTDYIGEIARTPLPFKPVALPRGKRVLDVVMALALMVIFSPVVLAVVIIYIVEYLFSPQSRGPLIYKETRISMGRPFMIYKFRIFKAQAAQSYHQEHGFVQTKALEADPDNLTFLGRILKKFYLDELPQLLNVLKGDMTMVGPRPSNEVVTWEDGKNGKFQRYVFKCGITGPFQIHKDSKNAPDQTAVDMEYIVFCRDNPGWKVVLRDIAILWETVFTVLRAKGI